VLSHWRGGGHGRRTARASASRRGQKKPAATHEGSRRVGRQSARAEAVAGGDEGRHVHHLESGRHRRGTFHADHQLARGRHSGPRPWRVKTRSEGQANPTTADAAHRDLLRSSRDRRRRGGAVHRGPGAGAGGVQRGSGQTLVKDASSSSSSSSSKSTNESTANKKQQNPVKPVLSSPPMFDHEKATESRKRTRTRT